MADRWLAIITDADGGNHAFGPWVSPSGAAHWLNGSDSTGWEGDAYVVPMRQPDRIILDMMMNRCNGCGRTELACSEDHCPDVIADRRE